MFGGSKKKKVSSILPIAAILSIIAITISATSAPGIRADGPDENLPILKIMTFNLRYGLAPDGPNSWDENFGTGNRKAIVVNLIENYRPLIIGTQEGYEFQLDYLAEQLDNYRWFGISRWGSTIGEYSAIFYDNGEVELKENGNSGYPTPRRHPLAFRGRIFFPQFLEWSLGEN